MRADHKTRFTSLDDVTDLSKQAVGVKLPRHIDAVIRSMPANERSVWLRKVIVEAVKNQDLLK